MCRVPAEGRDSQKLVLARLPRDVKMNLQRWGYVVAELNRHVAVGEEIPGKQLSRRLVC